ncbi:MAG: hypothetical protein IJ662_00230 [Clostridia bacterium]|nr:hypothetical protein [Clostridia bacterium]
MSQDCFTMARFAAQPTFSSFLPGIAGEWGIPVWCYYCNRGQAVASFGVQDKDHAIMEFSPAHVAYQNTKYKGFRTFLRYDDGEDIRVAEAFADDSGRMEIRPNELALHWDNGVFAVDVVYFVAPGCPVGALARQVKITNLTHETRKLTAIDGMPAVVCAGVGQDALKNMAQLAKAWMQVELDGAYDNCPYYRVRYSMADTATVHTIQEGNFALGLTGDGARLPPIVDPEVVFDQDTSLTSPVAFLREGDLTARREGQTTSNLFPCALYQVSAALRPGEALTLNELYGGAGDQEALARFVGGEALNEAWFGRKRAEAAQLAARLTAVIGGKTADPVFDAYSRQSYLDNLLRGGEPIRFQQGDEQNIFYLYSRKHGDMEREYNYFVMSPEYFSQGNGNFRDVCQNRRCDVLFHPWVGDANIRMFFSLLQSDGYNPLVIDRMTFRAQDAAAALRHVAEADRPQAEALLQGNITPGQLALAAQRWHLTDVDAAGFVNEVLSHAKAEPNATFSEGYWSDHWTYSLDLIESYLAVWPERKESLLFGAADYPWYETRALILPYEKRRAETPTGVRQVHYLDMERKAASGGKWMREDHGRGKTAYSTLIEKMALLCAVKYAALDPLGIGVQMEGGKPGWYDALNGLPGLFGSSVAESCELKRLLRFTIDALKERGGAIALYEEMAELLRALPALAWQGRTEALEAYREKTADGVAGPKAPIDAREAVALLSAMERAVDDGLRRAVEIGNGICPTYFMFPDGEGRPLPLFLEGPVRWLKLDVPKEEKRAMAARVKASGLYDGKLRMYKVNESLKDLTYEAGRCKAFTPGWLENESIWLHMEYKYLLELLRSGLYEEYEQALDTAAVPFMDPAVYGRSVYENVSFLASSANPNPAFHGRGFVARLSGSTVEFLSMWQEMMFGPAPFAWREGRLQLALAPMIPTRLIPRDGLVEATLLGQCLVRYHITGQGSLIPGRYGVDRYVVNGAEYPALPDPIARAVRDGGIDQMDVYLTIGT